MPKKINTVVNSTGNIFIKSLHFCLIYILEKNKINVDFHCGYAGYLDKLNMYDRF